MKTLAIIRCNIYYFIGDMLSKLIGTFDVFGHLYPLYNWCMIKSVDINDKYDLDCWE